MNTIDDLVTGAVIAEYWERGYWISPKLFDDEQIARLRAAHETCEEHRDIATASLIEVWIDETERRSWFLFEAGRPLDATGR